MAYLSPDILQDYRQKVRQLGKERPPQGVITAMAPCRGRFREHVAGGRPACSDPEGARGAAAARRQSGRDPPCGWVPRLPTPVAPVPTDSPLAVIRVHRFHYILEIDPASKEVLFVAPCEFTPKRVKAPKRKPPSDAPAEPPETKRAKEGADAETHNASGAPVETPETQRVTESADAEPPPTQDASDAPVETPEGKGDREEQPPPVGLLFGEGRPTVPVRLT